jgi:hypothetical protein
MIGRLLKELELHDSLDGTVNTIVCHIENEINAWFNRWDSVFQGKRPNFACSHKN